MPDPYRVYRRPPLKPGKSEKFNRSAVDTPLSTAVGGCGASATHAAVHGGGQSAWPERDELMPFYDLWERCGSRGGFYVHKCGWAFDTRFLVSGMVESRDQPGSMIFLGRLCLGPSGSAPRRMSQSLEQPLWAFAGFSKRRQAEDACLPTRLQASYLQAPADPERIGSVGVCTSGGESAKTDE